MPARHAPGPATGRRAPRRLADRRGRPGPIRSACRPEPRSTVSPQPVPARTVGQRRCQQREAGHRPETELTNQFGVRTAGRKSRGPPGAGAGRGGGWTGPWDFRPSRDQRSSLDHLGHRRRSTSSRAASTATRLESDELLQAVVGDVQIAKPTSAAGRRGSQTGGHGDVARGRVWSSSRNSAAGPDAAPGEVDDMTASPTVRLPQGVSVA